jgi:hypothetical protein
MLVATGNRGQCENSRTEAMVHHGLPRELLGHSIQSRSDHIDPAAGVVADDRALAAGRTVMAARNAKPQRSGFPGGSRQRGLIPAISPPSMTYSFGYGFATVMDQLRASDDRILNAVGMKRARGGLRQCLPNADNDAIGRMVVEIRVHRQA